MNDAADATYSTTVARGKVRVLIEEPFPNGGLAALSFLISGSIFSSKRYRRGYQDAYCEHQNAWCECVA